MTNTTENTTMEKTKREKTLRIVGRVVNIILWIFLVFAAVVTVVAISTTTNKDKVPSLFGYSLMTVESNSMAPEFYEGDLLIERQLSEEEKDGLKEDDIILYVDKDRSTSGSVFLNSHRVKTVAKDADGKLLYVVTQGDNREMCPDEDLPCYASDIRGIYEGKKVGGIGKALSFLRTSVGFLVCVVLPLIAFFIYELVIVIKYVLVLKQKGKKVITAEDEEIIKQRAVEEYLRRKAEQENAEQENAEEKKEE